MEDTYSKYKNEMAERLFSRFSNEDIEYILSNMDFVSYNYDIHEKQSDIIVHDDTLPVYCRKYLICKKLQGCTNSSIFSIESTLRTFFTIVNKNIEDVTGDDIRYYLFLFKSKGMVSDVSLDSSRGIVCRFFKWCFNEGYIDRNPGVNIKKMKITPGKPREPLDRMEIELMRRACDTLREKAVFEVMYSTGCRVAELCGLNKDDIDLNKGNVHLFGKGKKHRTSFLNARSKLALIDYLESRNDDNYAVFVSDRVPHKRLTTRAVEGIIGCIARRTTITKKVTPHVIRHTMATIALSNGMKVQDISILLGHASIDTTMIYAKVNMDDVKIKHSRCIV